MNHKVVSHIADALDYLDAAQATQDALQDAYDSGTAKPHHIAAYHQAINYGLKAGEVSALIGIGQQLERLVEQHADDLPITFDRKVMDKPCPVGGYHAYALDGTCRCGVHVSEVEH